MVFRSTFEKLCYGFDVADYGAYCPHCGWYTEDESDLCFDQVIFGHQNPDDWAAMEFGGNATWWLELWDCPECDGIFYLRNSSH